MRPVFPQCAAASSSIICSVFAISVCRHIVISVCVVDTMATGGAQAPSDSTQASATTRYIGRSFRLRCNTETPAAPFCKRRGRFALPSFPYLPSVLMGSLARGKSVWAENPSASAEKWGRRVAATAEAVRHELRNRVRGLAEPVRAGESVQQMIQRVARRAGLNFGQVKRLWYEEWAVVPAHVADTLRELDLERERAQARHGALKNEIDRALVASLAAGPAVAGGGASRAGHAPDRRRHAAGGLGVPTSAGLEIGAAR